LPLASGRGLSYSNASRRYISVARVAPAAGSMTYGV